ncbi:hypothetical protein J4G08_16545 [Candidatus Poribacteria bacterium]|nr:hypothetical protein [Candidatus Poribacteria bacterium]
MNNNLPTPDDLQKSSVDLCNIYAQHLKQHEVKIPKVKKYNQIAKSIWLAVLHYYKGEEIHKDDISKVCQRDKPGLGGYQQVRHLKRDGWHLTSDGKGNHLLDPYKPSPEWETLKKQKEGILNAKTFEDIKAAYDMRCATCGTKEGEASHRYGEDKVKLQRGHKDPSKPITKDNIIPQYQFCNRAYRGDYVFDDKGRVSAIADVRPVRKASETVQQKVFEWLKKRFTLL